MTYEVEIGEEAQAALRDFEGNFLVRLRRLVPSLPNVQSSFLASPKADPSRVVFKFDDDQGEWAVVGTIDRKGNRLVITSAYRSIRWPKLSREEAIDMVEAGIGKRPDLPSGSEYVRRIRGVWKGLLPSGRRDP